MKRSGRPEKKEKNTATDLQVPEKKTYLCTRFQKGSIASGKAGRRHRDGSIPYFSQSQTFGKRSLTYWKQKRKQNLKKKEKQLKVYINVRGHEND